MYFFSQLLLSPNILLCDSSVTHESDSSEDDSSEDNSSEENSSEKDPNKDSSAAAAAAASQQQRDDKSSKKLSIPEREQKYKDDTDELGEALGNISDKVKPSDNTALKNLQNKYEAELKQSKDVHEFGVNVAKSLCKQKEDLNTDIHDLVNKSISERTVEQILSRRSIDEVLQKERDESSNKRKHEDSSYSEAAGEAPTSATQESGNKRVKGSPIDFVIEKESTEMPGFGESDGE